MYPLIHVFLLSSCSIVPWPRPTVNKIRNTLIHEKYASNLMGDADSVEEKKCSVDYDIIIVGGGIAGLATAVGLTHSQKEEYKQDCGTTCDGHRNIHHVSPSICILEKARELKPIGATLGLFPNGKTALSSISRRLADQVVGNGIEYKGTIRMNMDGGIDEIIHDSDRQKKLQNGKGEENNATLIAWFKLQQYLSEAISNQNILQLGKKLESITYNRDGGIITVDVKDLKSGEDCKMTCKLLIGADGIKSTIRDLLFADATNYKYHNRTMYRAILHDFQFNATEILPEDGYTVAYRCGEPGKVFAVRQLTESIYSFTASVVVDTPGQMKLLSKKERLKDHFQNYPHDVLQMIECVSADAIYENEIWDIDFLDKWYRDDLPVVLIGDAAHAMTPKLGQGANMGLEDAAELSFIISQTASNIDLSQESILKALEEFSDHRLKRVREVHRVSREAVSGAVEKSLHFRDKIYQWKPSFVNKIT